MPDQDLLGEVDSEIDTFGASVVLQLAIDGDEARVVAPDNLILNESLFEGVGLLKRPAAFLQNGQQALVDLLRHGHV